jgi:hypothetical protein
MSAKAAAGVFIVAAKRTPFGSFGGKLKKLTPTGDIVTVSVSKMLSILITISRIACFTFLLQSNFDTVMIGC